MKKYIIGVVVGMVSAIVLLSLLFPSAAALVALAIMCSTGGCK